MSTKIFVNLPVKELAASRLFFEQMGYHFNPQFSDEKAACLIISEHIFVMLLTEVFFSSFTPKAICDTSTHTEVLTCLSAESKDAVNELVNKALAAGGTATKAPKDHGFMYEWGFYDLDGHTWEIMWMDPAVIQSA